MKQPKQKELIGLLRKHKDIKDSLVHKWAIRHGYSIDRVEEGLYKISASCLKRRNK